MLETSDGTLLDGRVAFRQPLAGYRAAIDPVLLAAIVPAQAGERVLDLGTGAGAVLLCLGWRVKEARLLGVERQAPLAALARHNLAANGCGERSTILAGDITLDLPAADHVAANPPYRPAGRGTPSPDPARETAHGEADAVLEDWVHAAARVLGQGGTASFVLPAARLIEAASRLQAAGFGALRILPLWPKAGRPAKRVLLHAIKGRRTAPSLLPGLVLHELDGSFTPAADAVLRHGAALAV